MSTATRNRRYRQNLKARVRAAKGEACVKCGSLFQIEYAHLQPTGLRGPGRGLDRRHRDILKNPDSYAPMCRRCHQEHDACH